MAPSARIRVDAACFALPRFLVTHTVIVGQFDGYMGEWVAKIGIYVFVLTHALEQYLQTSCRPGPNLMNQHN